jgi:hypothetical protein
LIAWMRILLRGRRAWKAQAGKRTGAGVARGVKSETKRPTVLFRAQCKAGSFSEMRTSSQFVQRIYCYN